MLRPSASAGEAETPKRPKSASGYHEIECQAMQAAGIFQCCRVPTARASNCVPVAAKRQGMYRGGVLHAPAPHCLALELGVHSHAAMSHL